MTEYKKTPEQEIESQLKTTLVELDRLREMLDATNQWPEVTRETAIIREALSQTLSPITDFAEAQRLKERLGEKPSEEFVASELINRYYKPSVIQQGLLAMLLNMPNVPNTYLIQVLENCIIEDESTEAFIAMTVERNIGRIGIFKVLKKVSVHDRTIEILLSKIPSEILEATIIHASQSMQARKIALNILFSRPGISARKLENLRLALKESKKQDARELIEIIDERLKSMKTTRRKR